MDLSLFMMKTMCGRDFFHYTSVDCDPTFGFPVWMTKYILNNKDFLMMTVPIVRNIDAF